MIGVGVLVVLCSSIVLCAVARWYAVRAEVVDHPTVRSSHVQPTPRGGGIGFVVVYLLALLTLYSLDLLELDLMVALVGAGTFVAAIGFADDHRHVPARYRFLVHVLAAMWVIYWLGMPSAAAVFGSSGSWPMWLSAVLAVLYVLWIINFYNFMDGIDGIASVEAVTVALGAALGRPARLFDVPTGALLAAASLTGRRDVARRLLGNLQVSAAKARTVLGWSPVVTVDEGLEKAVRTFLVDGP